MAAETIHPEKPVEEMMKNLKIDPSLSACDANMPAAKDGIVSDAISCISSGDATSSIKESDVDREGLMVDQGMYYPASNYYGYYYPGMVTSYTEWDDQGYYLGTDGMEFQHPAIQADNGSVVYYMPGLQPGYNPYSPYVPGAMIGVDGQYMGQQPYLSSPMVSQPLVSPGYFPPSVAYGQEFVPAYQWDSSHLFGGGIHTSGFAGDSTIPPPKPTFAKSTPPKSNTLLDMKGSSPALEVSPGPVVHNQSLKPVNKAPAVLSKGCFPVAKIPYNSNQGKSGILYPNSHINSKENGQSWVGTEKLRTRYKANGVGDFELLNEQNHGPRTNNSKNMWVPGVGPNGVLVGASDEKISKLTDAVSRDEYNLLDFPTKYDHALFFVIKSYSEDDIHKSIKYNVWASTPNGNKKLDNAFQVAQEKMREKGTKCPVFLFFSVNASGQFCGVAEMIGRVDFNKNMDFWQQDKWNGFFLVKWHIIKDVPNPQFRHIILENNDNKPVTNSRDTQEVKCSQGNEMLNIFKNFSSKTSILDDFGFYENRQKAMQDKRNKPPTPYLERFPPKNNEDAQIPKNDLEPPASTLQTTEVGEAKKNSVEPSTGIEVKE